MSRRWSYKVVEVKATRSGLKPGDLEETLTGLVLQGWESVAATPHGGTVRLYVKREQ